MKKKFSSPCRYFKYDARKDEYYCSSIRTCFNPNLCDLYFRSLLPFED